MSTPFIPEVTERRVVTTKTLAPTIANLPPVGTRLRATLGESVLVGTVKSNNTQRGLLIDFQLDGEGFNGFRDVTLWLSVGWEFEILEAVDANLQAVAA